MTNAALMLDLSSNNALPNLRKHWRAGYRVLALKATEGDGYTWHDNARLADEWHKRGGVVWHYHFAQPGNAEAQAAYFLGAVEQHWRHGDKLVLDAEVTGVDAAFVAAFIEQCSKHHAEPGVVYSYASFLTDHGIRPSHGWGLWLAEYGDVQPEPVAGWSKLTAWQFTMTAHGVPGESGVVDQSHILDPSVILGARGALPRRRKREAKQVKTVKKYAKAHVAAVGALATWASLALRDGHVTVNEWYSLCVVLASAFGVALFPNAVDEPKPPTTTSTPAA